MRVLAYLPLILLSAITTAKPFEVFVSVAPLKTFVEQVGGDHLVVRTMLQAGYRPATYDPSPQQIAALSKAALYVRTLAALIEQARREAIRVVFVQPQFDDRLAAQVARAIDGKILVADPLAGGYVDNLRRVAQQFAQAMQA